MPEYSSEFRGLDDWIHVFNTGRHRDSSGKETEWSEADLDSIVRNHSAEHPAPLVIGHPKTDSPRYGSIGQLKVEGGKLWAKAGDYVREFGDMVLRRQFPERSVAIDSDGAGGYKLRHLGFLGAHPPALELEPLKYGMDAKPEFTFGQSASSDASSEFMAPRWAWRNLRSSMRRIREFLIAKHNLKTADDVLPEHAIESIQPPDEPSATAEHSRHNSPNFSKTEEANMPETENSTQLAAEKKRADEAEAKLAAAEFAQAKSECKAFVSKCQDEGRLTPAQAAGLGEFMAALPAKQFTFAAESGNEQTQSLRECFCAFLGSLPKSLAKLTEEFAGADTAPEGGQFGGTDDADAKFRAYAQKHNCTYFEAVQAIGDQS